MHTDLTFITNEKGETLKQRFETLIRSKDLSVEILGLLIAMRHNSNV